MGKPTENTAAIVVKSTKRPENSIRLVRVGKGPLVQVWVHEEGNGGRGIILDVEQSDMVINTWQDMLDEIEEEEGGG